MVRRCRVWALWSSSLEPLFVYSIVTGKPDSVLSNFKENKRMKEKKILLLACSFPPFLLFLLSCSGCHNLPFDVAVLFWLPVLTSFPVLSCLDFQISLLSAMVVMLLHFCSVFHVLDFLSWLALLVFIFRLSCSGCAYLLTHFSLVVIFWLSGFLHGIPCGKSVYRNFIDVGTI